MFLVISRSLTYLLLFMLSITVHASLSSSLLPTFFLVISTPVLVVVYQSYQDIHCLCFLRTSLYLSCSAVVLPLFCFGFVLYVVNG